MRVEIAFKEIFKVEYALSPSGDNGDDGREAFARSKEVRWERKREGGEVWLLSRG